MPRPDLLDLYNECLNIVEETTDDRTAERLVFVAARILQMADEDFERHCRRDLASILHVRPLTSPAPGSE